MPSAETIRNIQQGVRFRTDPFTPDMMRKVIEKRDTLPEGAERSELERLMQPVEWEVIYKDNAYKLVPVHLELPAAPVTIP